MKNARKLIATPEYIAAIKQITLAARAKAQAIDAKYCGEVEVGKNKSLVWSLCKGHAIEVSHI